MDARGHRVALLDERGGTVLTVAGDGGPALPSYDDRWLEHAELAAKVGDPLALPIAPSALLQDDLALHVLVTRTEPLPPGDWRPVDALPAADANRIRSALADWRAGRIPVGVAQWYQRDWYDAATAWIDAAADAAGLRRTVPPTLFRAWGLSAVMRVPVEGGDTDELWFKATCDGFRAEPAVTGAVAALLPELTPDVVAVDADRAWLLMRPLERIKVPAEEVARRAAELGATLAHAQLDTIPHLDTLRDAGLPDRGLESTLAGFATAVHDPVDPTPRLLTLAAEIEPSCITAARELWGLGLPDTLNHGDLHLGNVCWPESGPVFFDWTDACVTHPYLDAHHLAASIRNDAGTEPAEAFWAAFQEPWRARFPDVDHDRVRTLARPVERIFQVVTYEQIARAQPAASRWELGGYVGVLLDQIAEPREELGAPSQSSETTTSS